MRSGKQKSELAQGNISMCDQTDGQRDKQRERDRQSFLKTFRYKVVVVLDPPAPGYN